MKKKRRVPWGDHVLRGQKRRTSAKPMYASRAQVRRGAFLNKSKEKSK